MEHVLLLFGFTQKSEEDEENGWMSENRISLEG